MLRPKNGRAQRSLRPRRALRRKLPQQTVARRALIVNAEQRERRSWIRHGVAGVAVAALGLGVAGSVALTGSAAARNVTPAATSASAGSLAGSSSLLTQRQLGTNRGTTGQPLDGDNIDPQAAAAAQAAAAKAQKQTGITSTSKGAESNSAAGKRSSELKSKQSKTEKLAAKLAVGANSAPATTDTAAATTTGQSDTSGQSGTAVATDAGAGHASRPITTRYTVAARFGQVGAWARYHTGFDFAAPLGTPIHAAADGVVTNAGPNARAGWAGDYVTVKHSDGTQTLYAHLASTSVSVGQRVAGGQVIGHIGMTGRSFGPHVHFEVYPAGIQPGDVYHAVNPVPWLEARGLHP